MNWKEIFKISTIVAVVMTVLGFFVGSLEFILPLETQPYVGLLVGGLIATYSVLNRRLKKEDWGVVVGILNTFVVYVILHVLLDMVVDMVSL